MDDHGNGYVWDANNADFMGVTQAEYIGQLKDEIDELQKTFDLYNKAQAKGIKMWQKATGRTCSLPDTADLTAWLLAENDRQRQQIKDLQNEGTKHVFERREMQGQLDACRTLIDIMNDALETSADLINAGTDVIMAAKRLLVFMAHKYELPMNENGYPIERNAFTCAYVRKLFDAVERADKVSIESVKEPRHD